MRKLNGRSPVGLSAVIICVLCCRIAAGQVYVDQGATGNDDGSSWENAFRDLQTALAQTTGGMIWVAAGVYRPANCNPCTEAERRAAFYIPPGVQLLGGFSGTETDATQRNWETNQTILSGDIGAADDQQDNAIHVLVAENPTSTTVLDGFIVQAGKADGAADLAAGGGLLITAGPGGTADLQVLNCTFRNNAAGRGAAIALMGELGAGSAALIRSCRFENNTATWSGTQAGGAIHFIGRFATQWSPKITNCIFRENHSNGSGGAAAFGMTLYGGQLRTLIDSCLFIGNRARGSGGALDLRLLGLDRSRLIVRNCQFLNNHSQDGAAIGMETRLVQAVNDTIANCLFRENRSDGDGGALLLLQSQARATHTRVVVNTLFDHNEAADYGGALAFRQSDTDFTGSSRTEVVNCTWYGNRAGRPGGIIHARSEQAAVEITAVNTIFWQGPAGNNNSLFAGDQLRVAMQFCAISGGVPPGLKDLGNNLDQDPQFVDPAGGDLGLNACSPLINAGLTAAIPVDWVDVDQDGNRFERIDRDLNGRPRMVGPTVDMGAYEFDGEVPQLMLDRSVTAESCAGSCDGSVRILPNGDQLGYTYRWSNGQAGPVLDGLCAGWYVVTVSNITDCITVDSVRINGPTALTLEVIRDTSICPERSLSLLAMAEGGTGQLSYVWNTGWEGAQTPPLAPEGTTNYVVTVTDQNGCTQEGQTTVTVFPPPVPTIPGTVEFCADSVVVLDAGNFSRQQWSTGSTDREIQVGTPGLYQVTVTDDRGCTAHASTQVSERDVVLVPIEGDRMFCPGSTTLLTAGPGFADYRWSTGERTPSLEVAAAGTYSLVVTDAAGCAGRASVQVSVHSVAPPQINGRDGVCRGDTIVLTASPGYDAYRWSTGDSTRTMPITNAGSYGLSVTDARGCRTSASRDIVAFDPPSVSITGSIPFCPGGSTMLDSGAGFERYLWSTGDAARTLRVTAPGDYEVTVTDSRGCRSSAAATVSLTEGAVAQDDHYLISIRDERSVVIDLLANDELPADTAFEFRLLTGAGPGRLERLGPGLFRYWVSPGEFGTAQFAYELCYAECPCAVANLKIVVEELRLTEAEVPNLITPNADGLNEFLVFDAIRLLAPASIPDNELIIFNRWGDIVFRMKNYDNSWNGVNQRGAPLPEGTYYYQLRLHIGDGKILSGDITVKR